MITEIALLGSKQEIISQNSQIAGIGFPFVDTLQCPQGKLIVIMIGSVFSPRAGGITGIVNVGICDGTFSFGAGPSVDPNNPTEVTAQSYGCVFSSVDVTPGENVPMNDDEGPVNMMIVLSPGSFIRAAAGAQLSGAFGVIIQYALIDLPDCECE